MSSCIAGLDDAEVFVDIELVAAFLSFTARKNGHRLAGNTWGKTGILNVFLSFTHISVTFKFMKQVSREEPLFYSDYFISETRKASPFCVISCESVTLCIKLLSIFPPVPLLVILSYWLLVLICTVRFYRPIKWLARGFQLCCSYEL